ncbi:reprolysin-like metallopeptidase [Spongiivirga citrea]|uniref:T9SS type A sorting domain-containing protein n=1 Tax=Spongiivirga citrea TaxID=1481457 RepID=A0A6M0CPP3_9FLAO|nr:zinc-dependent metalloprotease family protein [Spongiivirga citrea]NER18004.1 T9SS type A sorting domain-containing protein [Spongiivirga citrea]
MDAFKKNLAKAPKRINAKQGGAIMILPNADGNLERFYVYEASIMHPALAEKYPTIKSYAATGIDDPSAKARFSVDHRGAQFMIRSTNKSTVYIEPDVSAKQYVVYAREDITSTKDELQCILDDSAFGGKIPNFNSTTQKNTNDSTLRKYRLALSCSAEYGNFFANTGTEVADILAQMNNTMTRVNGIYELELGITMELVANNDQVIFFGDVNADPYTGNFNTETQTTLDNIIGDGSYDIGHSFNTSGGGDAGDIGSVCRTGIKGSAYTGRANPTGDAFDIDFVAHEIGHQFGGLHVQNATANCARSGGGNAEVEPGSGTTIMGYAGICTTTASNIQGNSDDYFNYVNIRDISAFVQTGVGESCAETIALTNNAPQANAGNDYVIPISTPFVLTGTATDADATDVLTYTWEQNDPEAINQVTPEATNTGGPLFRSRRPSASPSRYFPSLNDILAGNLTPTFEVLPSVGRTMEFAFTVRDNVIGGGQTDSDLMGITVDGDSGPFQITSQNSPFTWNAGETVTITWDVANTDVAPINVQNVNILLSKDGGQTFDTTLAANVSNNGSFDLIVPGNNATNQGRIMIQAVDNVFFTINGSVFEIVDSEFVLTPDETSKTVCQPDDVVYALTYNTFLGFNEVTTFSAVNPPTGSTVTFNPTTAVNDGDTVQMTVSGTASLAVGNYDIDVSASSASVNKTITVDFDVNNSTFGTINLSNPADAATNVLSNQQFEWDEDTNAQQYEIEFATDAAFTAITEQATTTNSQYIPTALAPNTQYFWRVRAINDCGQGPYASVRSFTTAQINCSDNFTQNLNLEILPNGEQTVTYQINVIDDLVISDLNIALNVSHTFPSDLTILLRSPEGTISTVFDRSCNPGSGEDFDDINATFDDAGSVINCSSTPPAIAGLVSPATPFSVFNGESSIGVWTLTINDGFDIDGGSLNSVALTICGEGVLTPDEDNDGVPDSSDICPNTPAGSMVDAEGCPIFSLPPNNFTLQITSETCRNSNNGSLMITSANTAFTFQAALTGAASLTRDFSGTTTFDDLAAGNYTVCFTLAVEPSFEQCFDIVITEPDPLSVSSRIEEESSTLVLNLSGATTYRINLNNEIITTQEAEVSLPLKKGINLLKVSTDIDCQGEVVESIIFNSQAIQLYPNPVTNGTAFITAGSGNDQQAVVNVHTVHGALLFSRSINVSNGIGQLDISNLKTGTYIIQVATNNQKESFKIIKR